MSKRTISKGRQYGDPLTPEQQAAAEKSEREREAYTRWKNTWLKFWQDCRNKACRRHERCSGDVNACWEEKWPTFPQILKDQIKLAIKFIKDGMPPAEAFRTAQAQLMRELQEEIARLGREAAGAASAQATDTDAPADTQLLGTIEPPTPRMRPL